jgi:hypothetical protein
MGDEELIVVTTFRYKDDGFLYTRVLTKRRLDLTKLDAITA